MAGKLDVPSPALLHDAARQEAVALEALLAATERGQSVHGARRRIKQLRSLLRLLRAGLGEAAYAEANAALRTAADALAGHRRAEALVAAAARLEGDGTGFWQGLAEAHRAAQAAEGGSQALASARQAVMRASSLLNSTPPAETGDDGAAGAFIAAYRKARTLLRKGLAKGDAETLHEARKFVIHHLHQLKQLRPERLRRIASLEALREVLGDLNDLDELEQLAANGAVEPEDARRLHKARRHLLRRAERAAERLFRHRPATWRKRMRHAGAAHSPKRPVALQKRQ